MKRTLIISALILPLVSGCQFPMQDNDNAERVAHWNQMRAAVRLKVAEDQLAAGRLADAAAELAEAVEIDPDNAHAALMSARLSLARGELEAAMKWLDKAEPELRRDPDFLLLRGMVMTARGETDLAVDDYADAFAADPSDDELALAYARALLTAGRLDEARAFLVENESRLASHTDYYLLLGDVYVALDTPEAAVNAFTTAERFGELPDHTREIYAALLLQMKRYREAIHMFEQLEKTDEEPSRAVTIGMARALLGVKRPDEARQKLALLLRKSEDDAEVWKLLAQATAASGEFRPAVLAAERATELATDDVESYQLLATIAGRDGQWDVAQNAIRRASALSPDDVLNIRLTQWIERRQAAAPGNRPVSLEWPSTRSGGGTDAANTP